MLCTVFSSRKWPLHCSDGPKWSPRFRFEPDERFIKKTKQPQHRCIVAVISGRKRRLPCSSVCHCIRCIRTVDGEERKLCLVENQIVTLAGSTSASTLTFRKHFEKNGHFFSNRNEKRISLDGTIIAKPRSAIEYVQVAFETQLYRYIVIFMQSIYTVQHDHFLKPISIASHNSRAPSRQTICRRLMTM